MTQTPTAPATEPIAASDVDERGQVPVVPPRALSRSQLRQFLAAAEGERYEDLIHFLAFTGVQLDEAAALCWQEVDLDAKTARIVRALRLKTESAPKTRYGRRSIDLPTKLVARLKVLPETSDLVFPNDDGDFVALRHIHEVLRRVAKRAGLPPIHSDTLRHTWATIMLNSGAPLNYVSRALGHHSTSYTARLYAYAKGPSTNPQREG